MQDSENQQHPVVIEGDARAHAVNVSPESNSREAQTPFGRYLLSLAHGYSKERSFNESGLTPTELVQARRDPLAARLEASSMRAGALGGSQALTRLLSQQSSSAVMADQIRRALDEDDTRKATGAARLILEASGAIGSAAKAGTTVALQVNVNIDQTRTTPD
jgi:hypothetical protein